jgi:hypothetical protein
MKYLDKIAIALLTSGLAPEHCYARATEFVKYRCEMFGHQFRPGTYVYRLLEGKKQAVKQCLWCGFERCHTGDVGCATCSCYYDPADRKCPCCGNENPEK